MDQRALRQSSNLFRGILRHIRSETAWKPDHEYTQADTEILALKNDEKQLGELFYDHSNSSARISISFPDYETSQAMTILLDNPLDLQLQYSDSGFVGELGETHHAIASRHETEYIKPIADPSLIARVRIPIEYDEQVLTKTLKELDAIALETENLHEELEATLQSFKEK